MIITCRIYIRLFCVIDFFQSHYDWIAFIKYSSGFFFLILGWQTAGCIGIILGIAF